MSLPQESGTVLLTGADGFVASHILSGLIARGYQVVAAVPSEKIANEILKLHPTWEYDITFAYVPDITADNAYDEAFRLGNGADYVIHTASPLNSNVSDIQRDIIDPAIKGTTGLLACAQRAGGKRLKRFVLLGSAVSVLNSFDKMSRPGKPYKETDWNPITAEYAIEHKDNVAGYNVSKKLTEQAAWKYMDDHKPSFDLTVLNPDIIIGPMAQHVPGPTNVNETNMFTIYNFLNGTYKSVEGLTFPFYHFVDVRDVAKAHILALTTPAASNKRIVLASGVISPQLIINTIRDNFLELQDRIIEGDPSQWMPRGVDPTEWDTRRSREVFGPKWHYIRLEKSIIDTVESLLEFEKSW